MADQTEMSPPGDQSSDHEELTANPTNDDAAYDDVEADVPHLGGQEMEDRTPAEGVGNGSLGSRYREILKDQREASSEVSSLDADSVDAAPRRAVSPIDSLMSGPDDTPSVQVCLTYGDGDVLR